METFIPEVETNEETPIEEEARPYEIIDVQTSYVYLYAIFLVNLVLSTYMQIGQCIVT